MTCSSVCSIPIENINTLSFNRKSEYLYKIDVVFVKDVVIEKETNFIVVNTNYIKENDCYMITKAARCFRDTSMCITDHKTSYVHVVSERKMNMDFLGCEILIDVDYDMFPIKLFLYRTCNTHTNRQDMVISGVSFYVYSYSLRDKLISPYPSLHETEQFKNFSAVRWIRRHRNFAYSWPLFQSPFSRDEMHLDYSAPLNLCVSKLCKSTFRATGYDVSFVFFDGDCMAPYDFEDIELHASGTMHFIINNMVNSKEWIGASPNIFMVRSKIGRKGVSIVEKILNDGRVELILSNNSTKTVTLCKKPIQFVPSLEMQAIINNPFIQDTNGSCHNIKVAEALFGLDIKYKAKFRSEKQDSI